MDETQISITIKPLYIERLLYWIIIIVLAVFLIIAWTKDTCDTTTKTAAGTTATGTGAAGTTPPPEQNTGTPPPAVTPPAETKPAETCSDSIKNQDESDIDCGGSKCSLCVSGKACASGNDCASGLCTSNVCTNAAAAPTLSKKVELTVTNAELQLAIGKRSDNTTFNRVKVKGISYKIVNGLAEDLDGAIAKVYIKNKAGTYCLNQQNAGTCDDPYATFSIGAIQSSKTLTEDRTFTADEITTKMGQFLISESGYDPTDDSRTAFSVVMYLYDSSGNAINGKIISNLRIITP